MESFSLTAKQIEATALLAGDQTHTMFFGGSRSGKTFAIMRAIIMRALKHTSRHAVLRQRFNHVKASIIYDTLPKVMALCYPEIAPLCTLSKTDWFYSLPNGSEIWFGGLDDKERTEKILGQEYSTIFLNECSQIGLAARNMALTRLAQNTPLKLRMIYDCNPPPDTHWTYRLFIRKVDPEARTPLSKPENYQSMLMNPTDNLINLPPEYLQELDALPSRMRRRFLLGEFVGSVDGALWTMEGIDLARVEAVPDRARTIIAVDPSGCSGEEDERSDEVGIVVAAIGADGLCYVLEDISGKYSPAQWGNLVASAFDRWQADSVVAETNYGGAMVKQVLRSAKASIPYREVKASRGKHIRAEPIAALFDQGKVKICGRWPKLEDQMLSFTQAGYIGDRSPDRADAMIWAVTDLFPSLTATRKDKQIVLRPSPLGFYGADGGSWLG